MQLDLAPHIIQLLFAHDTVTVPGLGSFVAQSASATADYASSTVSPPTKSLAFNDNLVYDDGLLTHEISTALAISTAEAKDQIDAAVLQMQTLLNQREIVALEGIGRLYKNYVQKIQFLPDAINFRKDTFGLQPLQFSPIARSREVSGTETAAAPISRPTPVQAPAEPIIAPPTPAVSTVPAATPAPIAPTTNTQVNTQINTPTSTVSGTSATYDTTSAPPFPWGRSLLILGLIGLSVGLTYYIWQNQKAKSLAAAQKSPIELPTENDTEERTENTVPAENVPAQQEPASSTPAPTKTKPGTKPVPTTPKSDNTPVVTGEKRCTLMIGLFKDEVNIERLKNKLSDAGYSVYAANAKNGGTMVGVNISYENMSEVQSNIVALQKLTGEQNIWIKKK